MGTDWQDALDQANADVDRLSERLKTHATRIGQLEQELTLTKTLLDARSRERDDAMEALRMAGEVQHTLRTERDDALKEIEVWKRQHGLDEAALQGARDAKARVELRAKLEGEPDANEELYPTHAPNYGSDP